MDLDFDQFDAVFDRFADSPTSRSVTRWEGRQTYAYDPESESLRQWRATGYRPEFSVRTSDWLARIATSTIAGGKTWRRVRYVEEPWTEYTAWELDGFGPAVAVGDDTLITTIAPSTTEIDYWLFDGQTALDRHVVLMHYTPAGEPARFEWTDDPHTLGRLHAHASEVRSAARPLNVYLAEHAVAGAH